MRVWDSMCATMLSTGSRRGAMMGTLRCDHPDVEAFVDAKRVAGVLRHFNLSVLVSDDFMRAVEADAPWALVFPAESGDERESVERAWSGDMGPRRCRVHKRVSARALWERIMRAAYDCAEPGVLFIDRIQRANNLMRLKGASERAVPVEDYAYGLFRQRHGREAALPPAFVDAAHVAPQQHIAMQAQLQRFVDNAISKTINVAADCAFGAFRGIYEEAYRLGLKGCAAFRPNPVTGALLISDASAPSSGCRVPA